jgi:hypothetical protein
MRAFCPSEVGQRAGQHWQPTQPGSDTSGILWPATCHFCRWPWARPLPEVHRPAARRLTHATRRPAAHPRKWQRLLRPTLPTRNRAESQESAPGIVHGETSGALPGPKSPVIPRRPAAAIGDPS